MRRIKISLFLFILPFFLSAQLREEIMLSGKWRFFKGGMESSNIEYVSIPHTWNDKDGTSSDYYRGEGCYSYSFRLGKKVGKNRVFLRFGAVSQEADVFLNGHYIGNHKGGFTAFCFEITPYIKGGKENELTVIANNAPNSDIAPLEGDFTIFGGIYRPVSLLILPTTCITPLDYASSGVYIKQTDISARSATIDITAKIDGNIRKDISFRTSVYDPNGKAVTFADNGKIEKSGNIATVEQRIIIPNPILWNGKKAPRQYRFLCEVLRNGKVVDSLSVYTGLRYFSIDREKGFFLNGASYQIRGVNRHQDRQGKGWAIDEHDQYEDMQLLKEIGANGVRLAHYPHSDFFYTLCDREGLLVWAEIPFVGKGIESEEFGENLKLQLTELIRQNFNHPSIFCWSLFNELSKESPEGVLTELNEIAHREDPMRFTVAAANVEGRPENGITDLMAFNTYPGWYWAQPETMGPSIEWKNNSVGKKGVGISEYGAGASIKHHLQGMKEAPKCDGNFHPEEWQAIVHERNYEEIDKRAYVWGTFVWNMFDFASAGRNEGDTCGMNDKGLVTYDRKIKKDAFYFYKANWSDMPVLYITSRRHTERNDKNTDVKIYSNCSNVVLHVNGVPFQATPKGHCIFIGENIELKPGKNEICVSGDFDGELITDRCEWFLND